LLHLGRPTRAIKALRNLRTSWLSREVALFSAFSVLSLAYAATLSAPVGVAAVMFGAAGVYASGRLYLVPARPVWNSCRTLVAFFATALATGPLLAVLCVDRVSADSGWLIALVAAAGAGSLVQLAVQWHLVAAVKHRPDRQHQGTAQLLLGRFRGLHKARLTALALGLALLASAATAPMAGAAAAGRLQAAIVVIALGELAGRYLFYVTVVPYRVAGTFRGTR
jgi:DMSO reductase anchor subunit